MLSLEELVKKISAEAELNEEEVKKCIEEKQIELSGLVSAEGAAYIVGRELGVDLLKESRRELKIKNVVVGMRSVDLVAKMINVFEPREFEKSGKKGKVLNIILGDDTGTIRLSLWNEEIDLFTEMGLKVDDTVKIGRAWVKEDNRGELEIRLGKYGKIEKTKGIEFPKLELKKFEVVQKQIQELEEGMHASVMGCLVQIYKRNPFFKVCPTCGGRVEEKNDKWVCKEHGNVKPEHQLVVSGVLDDGTGNIRAVFFRYLAEHIFGKNVEELRRIAASENIEALWDQFDSLGKEYMIKGKVRKNELTKELELIANEIEDVDAKKVCESLIKAMESQVK